MGAGTAIGAANPSVFNTMVQPTDVGQTTANNASTMGGMTLPLNNPTYSNAAVSQGGPNINTLYDPTGALSQPGTSSGYSGPAGTGGLSTLIPQQPNASNPNTPTLGTGQTANPYMNSTNPYIQAAQATTMGNLYGAQAATQANRINQNTPYGSLSYTQSRDANGNPVWTANQQLSQPLQDLTNTSLSGLQSSLQNPMYGINPGQTYSDAIMSRLQPQIAQQSELQNANLANQGIVPGTKAYENSMRSFQQGQNDLLTSAQIQGMNTGLQAQQLQNQQAANIKALGNPNYINPYSQAAVAGPDYLGAYTTANAADIAKQNAANARTANTQNGLFGLGSAALLGSGGIGNVLGSTGTNGTGGSGLLGLGGSAYNSLFGSSPYNTATNNFFTNPTAGGTFSGLGFQLPSSSIPDISNISTADWMSGAF